MNSTKLFMAFISSYSSVLKWKKGNVSRRDLFLDPKKPYNLRFWWDSNPRPFVSEPTDLSIWPRRQVAGTEKIFVIRLNCRFLDALAARRAKSAKYLSH